MTTTDRTQALTQKLMDSRLDKDAPGSLLYLSDEACKWAVEKILEWEKEYDTDGS